ncbi:phosphoribosyl-AMP cyclohydrolase [Allohahella marinimesophila]|uniref:Phosphoribosyl-AMP cyclohydrolase n=1 Tax=Allohahella marinimesophila TaxID=1054972 RepID=A0ABP7PL34_9GAMM
MFTVDTAITEASAFLDEIRWNHDGLVNVVAQDAESREILMQAWMNREALLETLRRGEVVYWSRSRQKLWHKGEESGHVQKLHALRLDCDGDVIVADVEQVGGIACHTGRANCFFRTLAVTGAGPEWVTNSAVLKDMSQVYSQPQGTSHRDSETGDS